MTDIVRNHLKHKHPLLKETTFYCFKIENKYNKTAETKESLCRPESGTSDPPVVPDASEKVQGFPQPVGVVVFPYDHVVAAAGHHEDDGSDVCKNNRDAVSLGSGSGTRPRPEIRTN